MAAPLPLPSIAAPTDIASANEQYGQLKANLFIAGFTLERAFKNFLEPLISGDGWRHCGAGYGDVNAFLDSLRLDKFKQIAVERKEIVRRIKELQPALTSSQIGRTLGVSHTTVDRDLSTNVQPPRTGTKQTNALRPNDCTNVQLTGRAAAVTVHRREHSRPQQHALNPEDMPEGQWPLLLVDPPWRYENPPMGGGNRSIENHYPTMPLDEICAVPVPAADNAILYLWATAPKLAECFRVIEAWGFTYRTNLVWVKDKIGMGYHARSQHELLLIAKRGEIPPPLPQDRVSSVIAADRGNHSEKPPVFYELIENWYPALSKVELFARGEPRDGWAAWGNQLKLPEIGK